MKLVVDDAELAAAVLEDKCHIVNFDVPKAGVLRVFDRIEDSWEINRDLIQEGVRVKESYLAGQDLEGYFMDLLGGESNV